MGNDRYAYVNNNPIGFNDPSGHVRVCSGDGGYDPSCAGGGEKHNNQSTIPTSTTPSLDNATSGRDSRRDRNIHDRTCQIPYRCGTVEYTTDGEVIAWTFEKIYDGASIYLDYISRAYPMYRNLKGIIPNPGVEALIGAAFQLIRDKDRNYTSGQRMARAGIVGLENLLTDVLSDFAGLTAATVAIGGGPLAAGAYVVGSTAMNAALEVGWDKINEEMFPEIGLGNY
jgi:hypothetical protein